FYDEAPLANQQSFYRLELGNLGISQVLTVFFVDFSNQQTYVKPNPAKETSTLYFKNPLQMEHQLSVFGLSGKLLFQAATREAFFTIPVFSLHTGTYLLRVSQISTGRIVGTNRLIVLK
ncbi:MAG: T9SS type A sorting domain-containing protein, partial [Bacteroidales bacterium]|nr:T9SS type A sorting domain-containing protein [Bacteroidales bacterium]